MTIKDEIMQAIETLVRKEIQKYTQSRDIVSTITDISGDKYKINIDGHDYWVKDGIGLNLKVGMQVWIRKTGKDMYIASRK